MGNLFAAPGLGGILLVALCILVVILLIVVISLTLRVRRLSRRYRIFMKGQDGQSVEKAMAARIREMEKVGSRQKRHQNEIGRLRESQKRTLTKYGIVKYDAFEDVGGKLSFALAMLDSRNTGFILDAIHSRDNCFLYLKEIVEGESYIMLSDEEIRALNRAAEAGEDDEPETETEK